MVTDAGSRIRSGTTKNMRDAGSRIRSGTTKNMRDAGSRIRSGTTEIRETLDPGSGSGRRRKSRPHGKDEGRYPEQIRSDGKNNTGATVRACIRFAIGIAEWRPRPRSGDYFSAFSKISRFLFDSGTLGLREVF